jgi:predicted RND superfamily exporter protein
MKPSQVKSTAPIISRLDDFDRQSGSWLERLLFNHRLVVIVLCTLVTGLLVSQLPKLELNASFERMIPSDHLYIKSYQAHKEDLAGEGNVLRIVVENRDGNILDKKYLEKLQKINDEIYLLGGVNRPFMLSLWTPTMRWLGITESGIEGDAVIGTDYDGSPSSLEKLRQNIERSGEIGRVVARDFKSSMLLVPLLDFDSDTGKPIDYGSLSQKLEDIRSRHQDQSTRIYIVGFAKVVGDLIEGLWQMLSFFALAMVIAAIMVYWFTRCIRSTTVVMFCSLVAVVWLLGALPILGFELDPYSVLVPFLVFAIGMSHGAQKMNGVMQDIGRGTHRLIAARYTFRRLFLAGLTALLCDAVGFGVLLLIHIEVIRQLALIASLGVALLVFTNLILLPILLSYTGVGKNAAMRSLLSDQGNKHRVWHFLDLFTQRKVAIGTLIVGFALGVGGWVASKNLQIGDLDPGAPELRTDSRYNLDNLFISNHYENSSDVFMVMVESNDQACQNYDLLARIDALEWRLKQLPGVVSTSSFSGFTKALISQFTEGNPKWMSLVANQALINEQTKFAPRSLINQPCNLSILRVFLTDHKADTLKRLTAEVEAFAEEHNNESGRFMLAAGNAGIEAATNVVVEKASREMLYWVYAVVALLCFVTFRSWRAMVCAVLPLMLTSILAEALMVWLGIGVKVATLPVIALGVGIGVDYALYVMSIVLVHLRRGESLSHAYYQALIFTGKVVLLTGLTLSVGVATWFLSPIKFQADMGLLLAFCFLFNMLGALVLLPSLAALLFRSSDHGAELLESAATNTYQLAGQTELAPERKMDRNIV